MAANVKPARERPACELTILMPCLDEAATLGRCIGKARAFLAASGVDGEVLIADNGSRDGSPEIAAAAGARVIAAPARGYGNALIAGIKAARGRYVIMGDCDDSYDFSALAPFLERLRAGFDLVMGNRFQGGIAPGAMPLLHRYLGNPVLSAFGRLFFKTPCGDFHCGLRGFRREAVLGLDLAAPGMEFASEMVVKATIRGLRIVEVPTTLAPDGRDRAPHLRSWRDGWRHLRFLLLFSPRWLFLYPGAVVLALGLAVMAWLLPGPGTVGGVTFDIHTLFYAGVAVVVGFHAMLFWVFATIHSVAAGLLAPDPWVGALARRVSLEAALVVSVVLLLIGLGLAVAAVGVWDAAAFGSLSVERTMRLVIPSGAAILLAFQIATAAFFIAVLEMRASRPTAEAPPRHSNCAA